MLAQFYKQAKNTVVFKPQMNWLTKVALGDRVIHKHLLLVKLRRYCGLKFAELHQKIWSEAYQQNDSNILKLLETNNKADVVDIGCGDGQKTIKFKGKIGCTTIVGVDGQEERLKAARKRGVNKVICTNLEERWPLKSGSFDVVISNQVIEHLVDIDHFIKEIKRILKPGGYTVVSTENLSSWHNIFALILGFQDFSHHLIKKAHVGNPLSQHYGEETVTWSAKDNSGVDDTAFPHLRILTYYSVKKVFEEYGFKFEGGLGSGYYPLFGYLSRIATKIDPGHSHFITIKMRKPI